jgi:hypothetical protein
MGSGISARSIIAAVGLASGLTLAACTSAPPKPGQSIAEIETAQDETFRRPEFTFQSDTHRIALYHDNTYVKTIYVFEDDRYLCWLHPNVAADFSACLAQPDGLALLAGRLQSLCAGSPDDPLKLLGPDGMSTVGDLRCPPGTDGLPPIVKAKDEQAKPTSVADAVGGIAYGTTQAIAITSIPVVVPLVLIPSALVYSAVGRYHDHPSLVAQEKLHLGMTAAEVTELMGTPTARFFLEPAHTEVWYFKRSVQSPLWIGFADNHLIWLRYTYWDSWLTALTTRSLKAAEIPP